MKWSTHTAPYVVHYRGHAYTLRKLSCDGGAHFLRHSVEGVLLSVPNVFQTDLSLHLSCCVIPSCCDKGRAWASSLARSLWFHCSLSGAFRDKRASSIASQPWFCVLLGLSVSTVFHIPTLCHPFLFILPFLEFCHVFERHAFDLQVVTVIKVVY